MPYLTCRIALLRCCSWSCIVCSSFLMSLSLSDRTGSWEWKLRSTFFILHGQSKKCCWVNLLCDQLRWVTNSLALVSLFLSPRGSRLNFRLSAALTECFWGVFLTRSRPKAGLKNHPSPTKRISEAWTNKPGWHLPHPLSYHTRKLYITALDPQCNSVVCTHLFIISSCFSLASSYLSAKRSAISRKLFLYASEKCLFTLD